MNINERRLDNEKMSRTLPTDTVSRDIPSETPPGTKISKPRKNPEFLAHVASLGEEFADQNGLAMEEKLGIKNLK